jgi:hypothetical protein
MIRPLVEDGRLTVPLFHGTSSLFCESIRTSGLGGRNVVEDMGIRKAAASLLELTRPYEERPEWLSPRDACARIAADPSTQLLPDRDSMFSFRYGGTYVSASSETAANYALLYPGGGESLTYTVALYRLLSSVRPDLAERKEFITLRDFAAPSATPLLVEARDVEITALRAEQGGKIARILACMEDALQDYDNYDFVVGQHNFDLTHPVPPHKLRFHTVSKVLEFDDVGASREVLQLVPLRRR